jgi:hypothetical protein
MQALKLIAIFIGILIYVRIIWWLIEVSSPYRDRDGD